MKRGVLPLISSPQPLLCPVLIGRVPSVAILVDALQNVRLGNGRCILIAGDAGVGKSRLVTELRNRATVSDVDLFQGSCFESDQTTPYAPIADLFRDRSGQGPQRTVLSESGDQAARLVSIFPELAARGSDPATVAALDRASEQRRLFDAFITVLARASTRRPVILVVEDLHWIDEGSLAFLLFAARRLSRQPVLFVLTYRANDAAPEVLHAVAELNRERLGIEIQLAPLAENEIDLMVQAIVGLHRPLRSDVLSFLFELTDGNPFFIEEVLKSQQSDGSPLCADVPRHQPTIDDFPVPRTILDAVQRRLRGLTHLAKQALALAAVAGRQFDFEVLRLALKCDEEALLDAMRDLIAAQLVVEGSADRFAFRHALTRQAVAADLLVRERRALHQTLLTTLEDLATNGKGPPLADLAEHAFGAESWNHALDYSRRAGDAALGMYAPHAAIAHYTRAIEAAKLGQLPVPLEVVRERGIAYGTVGKFDGALVDHETTLQQARARGDRRAEWRALIDLGFLWSERDYTKSYINFSDGLKLSRAIGTASMLASSLNRLGNWHMNRENLEVALRFHREALALFEAEGDRPGIADTLGLLATTTSLAGDLAASSRWASRSVGVYRELGDRAGTAMGLAAWALCGPTADVETVVPSSNDLATGIEQCEEATRIAREIGWRSGEVFASIAHGFCLIGRGSYGPALATGIAARELADEIEHHQWMAASRQILGRLFQDLFAYAMAREHLESALALARAVDSAFWVHYIAGLLASLAIAEGAVDEARAILDTDLPLDSPVVGVGRRTGWCARVELALARQRPAEALQMTDRLIKTAGGDESNPPVPRLWMLRADALIALGRFDEALAALDLARDAAIAQGRPPLVWRIDQARATAYRGRRQYVLADEATAQALSTIEGIAENISDDALRSTFLAGATARLSPPSPRRVDRIAHDGLTARETEIAVLIARGLTNRLIAESLVLSERTVETHVKHILSKLSVASRAQVAAWAAGKGLLHP